MAEIVSDPILSLLRERGLLDEMQVDEVVQECTRSGKPAIEVIQNYGYVDLDSILQVMADHLGTMVVSVDPAQIGPEVVATVPSETARMYQCLPVALYGDTVQIALVDPLNPGVIDELGFTVKFQIQIVVASPAEILAALEKFYPVQVQTGYTELLKTMGEDGNLAAEI